MNIAAETASVATDCVGGDTADACSIALVGTSPYGGTADADTTALAATSHSIPVQSSRSCVADQK